MYVECVDGCFRLVSGDMYVASLALAAPQGLAPTLLKRLSLALVLAVDPLQVYHFHDSMLIRS